MLGVSSDLKSLLLMAMAPLSFGTAPAALPADPGVDRRGVCGPGVRRGGSGLTPWALAPWLRPTGLGVAPRILLPRPATAPTAAGSRATSPSPPHADCPAASSCRELRCCLMAQLQNSSKRIWPPSFLSRHHQSKPQNLQSRYASRCSARDRRHTHVSISRKEASASVICMPHSACKAAACHQPWTPHQLDRSAFVNDSFEFCIQSVIGI